VLTEIIAAVREVTFWFIGELVTRLDLILVRVTVRAERLLMAGCADLTSGSSIKAVFAEKIGCAVIHSSYYTGMAI